MKPHLFSNFDEAIRQAGYQLQFRSNLVHSARWQGSDISDKPEMATHEVAHCSFGVQLDQIEDLDVYRNNIKPNLPWADDHFLERVCGSPINPGIEWRNWPYGKSAERFLDDNAQFNHNYMERYWPKLAGRLPASWDAEAFEQNVKNASAMGNCMMPNQGIRYEYGDLNDVVELLLEDPFTRQAYLPVWFPEDTGGGSKRAPCTIGYHFMMRENLLDINYEIRSCDFVRHFRDDLYLTTRLLLWVLDRCREKDNRWKNISPGKFYMQIGSLHVFRNDYQMLFGGQ